MVTVEEMSNSYVVQSLCAQLEERYASMRQQSTPKLWLQYLDMVDILMKFLKGRAYRKLYVTLANYAIHVTLFGGIRASFIHEICIMYILDMQSIQHEYPTIYDKFDEELNN